MFLIRTQDRKNLIPFESVHILSVGGKWFLKNGICVLGNYFSEERCIEVLDGIQAFLNSFKNEAEVKIFEMPIE